jgi:molecular chaperone GrpE
MSEKENIQAEEAVEASSSEPDMAPPDSETGPDGLSGMLEDARNKADEHWNQCLRLQADIENLRKRHERELGNAHKFALERFAQELLPVRDSLEMGLSTFTEGSADIEKLHQGVELTLQMLTSVLEKFGIKEIDPQNEPFNPDFHQAMSVQERDDVEANSVVTVVQKGYLLHDRLIRPAMVIVSRAPVASDSTPGSGEA